MKTAVSVVLALLLVAGFISYLKLSDSPAAVEARQHMHRLGLSDGM